ncbi:MAG: hypothetical protein GTO40_12270 [Deltaproteobacteria bacterium]|nr:hypothetical protein [Deltaproteobacteria bacterium]
MLRKSLNNTRQAIIRLIVLLVTVAVIGFALAASESKPAASDAERVPTTAVEERKKPPSPPSQPFVPSEKVSADRAVSFPTDI